VDWDDAKRSLDISDPYLRFYLRWQIRQGARENGSAAQSFSLMTGDSAT
jgi:hypothetical protein